MESCPKLQLSSAEVDLFVNQWAVEVSDLFESFDLAGLIYDGRYLYARGELEQLARLDTAVKEFDGHESDRDLIIMEVASASGGQEVRRVFLLLHASRLSRSGVFFEERYLEAE